MNDLLAGMWQAVVWLLSGHAGVYLVVWTSTKIVTTALALATLLGVPLGVIIAVSQFRGKRLLVSLCNTLLSMPTVVVGLTVYAFLSRQGPLGELGLLFTPWAVIIGDVLLALPILVALTIAAVQGTDPRVRETALSLGAGSAQAALAVLGEARFALCAAVVAGFGRVIAEVGAAMMLGGNIRGYTRTMTTAIALETSKGDFVLALALGFVLLIVAFVVNIVLYYLQGR